MKYEDGSSKYVMFQRTALAAPWSTLLQHNNAGAATKREINWSHNLNVISVLLTSLFASPTIPWCVCKTIEGSWDRFVELLMWMVPSESLLYFIHSTYVQTSNKYMFLSWECTVGCMCWKVAHTAWTFIICSMFWWNIPFPPFSITICWNNLYCTSCNNWARHLIMSENLRWLWNTNWVLSPKNVWLLFDWNWGFRGSSVLSIYQQSHKLHVPVCGETEPDSA